MQQGSRKYPGDRKRWCLYSRIVIDLNRTSATFLTGSEGPPRSWHQEGRPDHLGFPAARSQPPLRNGALAARVLAVQIGSTWTNGYGWSV